MPRSSLTASKLAPLAVAAVLALPVVTVQASSSVGSLRTQIRGAGQRERALAAGAGGAGAVIAALSSQLALLSGRVAAVQQQLAQGRAQLALLSAEARVQRSRAGRLRSQLVRQRTELASWLVAVYESGRPSALEVLTSAHGFADVLERMDFLHRLSEHAGQITEHISAARAATRRGLARVVALGVAAQRITAAAAAESAALQSISGALVSRREVLGRVRQLQLSALDRTRAQRIALRGQLARELAALAAPPPARATPPALASTSPSPTASTGTPSGGFAIPWAIVQCESGGQNLPPNSSGASGYYQILPATWRGAGGRTAQAYQAPKAEQDTVAARLWAGGAGASNWVCASLVTSG